MKLSTKTRYAASVLTDLASAYSDTSARVPDVAEAASISVTHIERILNTLY